MIETTASKNATLIVCYLYLSTVVSLLSFIQMNFIIEVLLIVILSLITVKINQWNFNFKIVLFYLGLLAYALFYLPLTETVRYPVGDLVNILLYSFIPIFIFAQNNINYQSILEKWKKAAEIFSIFLPVLLFFREMRWISYYNLGYAAHLNILILVLYFFALKDYKMRNFLLIVINTVFLLIWGSRLVLLSTAITSVLIILFLVKEEGYKKIFKITLSIFAVFFLVINLSSILSVIDQLLDTLDINSRNITLIMQQLEGGLEAVLGRRQDFYPQMMELLKGSYGLPRGFGVIRTMTNGEFYHAHNFVVQFILTFGLLALFAFSLYVLLYGKRILKESYYANSKFYIYFISIVSFLLRSIAGTNFYNDFMFFIIVGMLFSSNYMENKNQSLKETKDKKQSYITNNGGSNESFNG